MWNLCHSNVFSAAALSAWVGRRPRNIKRGFAFVTAEKYLRTSSMLSLLYQRNIAPVLARFTADLEIKKKKKKFKKSALQTSKSVLHQVLANISVYITVTDLTTILFAVLIAIIVFNISELCLKWGGGVDWESGSWPRGALKTQKKPWTCSSTVAHKHQAVFSFPRGKAVFTRLSSFLADMASIA